MTDLNKNGIKAMGTLGEAKPAVLWVRGRKK